MELKKSDYYYDLPEELIAQNPLKDRSSSRLLHVDKISGEFKHYHFTDVLDFLQAGDCLVLNDTKVIPARLYGIKEETGAVIEVLLLKNLGDRSYEVLVKPGKKARPGAVLNFGDGLLKGTVVDVLEEGNRKIQFEYEGIFNNILDQIGVMPLPPYIKEKLEDKDRYQTVYAKNNGSAAAPTAGLHFTQELLKQIEEQGTKIAKVTLHVGLGTFRPVKVENIEEHKMHSEFFNISEDACNKINETRKNGGRIICVGTTSCRVLESLELDSNGNVSPTQGDTSIFIYPGYKFKLVDNLITNFHLPESTLLMLISALAGREKVLKAYEEAVKEKYRFFSFGDAMYIC